VLLSRGWDNVRVAGDAVHEVVELQVGDEHVLRLPGQGTAGYRWAREAVDDDSVAEVSDRQVEEPESEAAGASGSELFRVRALAAGSTRISFAQRRPWEGDDSAPASEHVVELRVRD
jgi:predicted secreted protein